MKWNDAPPASAVTTEPLHEAAAVAVAEPPRPTTLSGQWGIRNETAAKLKSRATKRRRQLLAPPADRTELARKWESAERHLVIVQEALTAAEARAAAAEAELARVLALALKAPLMSDDSTDAANARLVLANRRYAETIKHLREAMRVALAQIARGDLTGAADVLTQALAPGGLGER